MTGNKHMKRHAVSLVIKSKNEKSIKQTSNSNKQDILEPQEKVFTLWEGYIIVTWDVLCFEDMGAMGLWIVRRGMSGRVSHKNIL